MKRYLLSAKLDRVGALLKEAQRTAAKIRPKPGARPTYRFQELQSLVGELKFIKARTQAEYEKTREDGELTLKQTNAIDARIRQHVEAAQRQAERELDAGDFRQWRIWLVESLSCFDEVRKEAHVA